MGLDEVCTNGVLRLWADDGISMIRTNPVEMTNHTQYGWMGPSGLVPKCTVVRAMAYRDGCFSPRGAAGAWLVGGTPVQHALRVVSLMSDYDNLFGVPYGIYVPGDIDIDYPLFSSQTDARFKRFLLRNSGNDWSSVGFRDAMMQQIFRACVRCDTQDYEPAVVYVNGEYWGVENIREQYSPLYLEQPHRLPRRHVHRLF